MRLLQTATGWEVWTPAKVNLFLEVQEKRPDGFHEIETLMAPIDLYDTLYVREAADGQTQFECLDARRRGSATQPSLPLPTGADNIVIRAVSLLRHVTGSNRGVALRLVKRIPLAAGLAGGSSDAAAALAAVNCLWRTGLSHGEQCELAAQLGSDIPFFLADGPAVCRGRGERVEPLRALPALHLVVAYPGFGLVTALVYGRCRPEKTARALGPLVDAWRSHNFDALGSLLHNTLQPAAAELSPNIEQLRERFENTDVVAHQMSGSGASWFGVCRTARHARRVAARLECQGAGVAYALHTLN